MQFQSTDMKMWFSRKGERIFNKKRVFIHKYFYEAWVHSNHENVIRAGKLYDKMFGTRCNLACGWHIIETC